MTEEPTHKNCIAERDWLRREYERAKAENERLKVETEALKSQRGISALLAMDRTQRERELMEENARLREANRRLQTEGPALERDKLVGQLRAEIADLSGKADEAIRLMNKTSLEFNKTKAQLAATDQALQEVQRESAELREEKSELLKLAKVDHERISILRAALEREVQILHRWRGHSQEDVRTCSVCAASDLSSRMLAALAKSGQDGTRFLAEIEAARKAADAAVAVEDAKALRQERLNKLRGWTDKGNQASIVEACDAELKAIEELKSAVSEYRRQSLLFRSPVQSALNSREAKD